jgi:hypothetical protein
MAIRKKMKGVTVIRNSTAEFLTFAYRSVGDDIEVRVQDGTIWLTQKLMGKLFDTTSENVIAHLNNTCGEKELTEETTTEDLLVVRQEGTRNVNRSIQHYDPDAVIAPGYRINSEHATGSRCRATAVLRDHTLRCRLRKGAVGLSRGTLRRSVTSFSQTF